MGEKLAQKIRRQYSHLDIDVVIPIPDSSRPSGLQLATALGVPYREGFVKNRYIGRTFIMPGHGEPAQRRPRCGRQGAAATVLEPRGIAILRLSRRFEPQLAGA